MSRIKDRWLERHLEERNAAWARRWGFKPGQNSLTSGLIGVPTLNGNHSRHPENIKENEASTPDSSWSLCEIIPWWKGSKDETNGWGYPAPEWDFTEQRPQFAFHFSLTGRNLWNSDMSFNFQTMITASRTIFFDILDTPACLSIKIIGISPTRNPFSTQR